MIRRQCNARHYHDSHRRGGGARNGERLASHASMRGPVFVKQR